MRKYLCGVPRQHCCGSFSVLNAAMPQGTKVHNSTIDAFKCMATYLISQGYKQVGSREFKRGDEPRLVLTRKSKYGASLRMGKNQDGTGKRVMPRGRKGSARGTQAGTIIG